MGSRKSLSKAFSSENRPLMVVLSMDLVVVPMLCHTVDKWWFGSGSVISSMSRLESLLKILCLGSLRTGQRRYLCLSSKNDGLVLQ